LPKERIGAGRDLASTAMGATAYVEEALRWLPDGPGPGDAARTGLGMDDAEALPRAAEASRGARILLADDNADMRDYVARLLAEEGYRVEPVANGAAALEAVRRERPDLVLSDVMMPELDGFGLLQALRGDPSTRAIPVVLLSARAG